MPFALIIIGLLLIVSGARGTYPQLKALLISDFTGPHNFLMWIVALGGVGCLGYIPQLEKFSRVFLALILISMLLAEKGFFAKFSDAITNFQPSASTGGQTSASASTASGLGGALAAVDNFTGNSAIGSIVSSVLGK